MRAAPCLGTAAVVKMPASFEVDSVSPRGSVAFPGSASLNLSSSALTQAWGPLVASAVLLQVSLWSTCWSRKAYTGGRALLPQ